MEMFNTSSTLHLQLALAPANHELKTPPHEFQLQHKTISEPSHINIVSNQKTDEDIAPNFYK